MKPSLTRTLGGLERLFAVGEQVIRIGRHFQLDPVAMPLAARARRDRRIGLIGIASARGIRATAGMLDAVNRSQHVIVFVVDIHPAQTPP